LSAISIWADPAAVPVGAFEWVCHLLAAGAGLLEHPWRHGRDNGCSVSALLSHVDREVHLRHGGVKNFSGLVRVVCVMHGLRDTGGRHARTPIEMTWRAVQSYGCTARI
jgi:hypothetical protein